MIDSALYRSSGSALDPREEAQPAAAPASEPAAAQVASDQNPDSVLVRYGRVPEVAKFRWLADLPATRGSQVVVRSHRGLQLGLLLEPAVACSDTPVEAADTHEPAAADDASAEADATTGSDVAIGDEPAVVRMATDEDLKAAVEQQLDAEDGFSEWTGRIEEWNLDLELIDLEWTLDRSKLILYVLNERGPDCTRLAIQAAAAGLATVEVQPVNAEGPVQAMGGGGCGSGGCGSGGCGTKGGHH